MDRTPRRAGLPPRCSRRRCSSPARDFPSSGAAFRATAATARCRPVPGGLQPPGLGRGKRVHAAPGAAGAGMRRAQRRRASAAHAAALAGHDSVHLRVGSTRVYFEVVRWTSMAIWRRTSICGLVETSLPTPGSGRRRGSQGSDGQFAGRFLDAADIQERGFGQVVPAALENFTSTPHRLGHGHVLTWQAGGRPRRRTWADSKTVPIDARGRPADDRPQAVQLVKAENGNDLLQFLVALQHPLRLCATA